VKPPTKKSWATEQGKRLAVLRDYPFDQTGRSELAKALARSFPTEADAKKAVDRMVTELDQCPTPATIRRYAEAAGLLTTATDRLAEVAAHQKHCHECSNTGWATVEVPKPQRFSEFCECPLGQAMKTGRRAILQAECPHCEGVGMVILEKRITVSQVKRCACPVGRRMAGDSRITPDQRGKQGNLI
jgi:hypothetical protein